MHALCRRHLGPQGVTGMPPTRTSLHTTIVLIRCPLRPGEGVLYGQDFLSASRGPSGYLFYAVHRGTLPLASYGRLRCSLRLARYHTIGLQLLYHIHSHAITVTSARSGRARKYFLYTRAHTHTFAPPAPSWGNPPPAGGTFQFMTVMMSIVDQLYDDVPTLKSTSACLNSLRVVSPGNQR